MVTKQSKEVKIQREVEKCLTSYSMEFVTQNESVNPEIEKALSKAPSKRGCDTGLYVRRRPLEFLKILKNSGCPSTDMDDPYNTSYRDVGSVFLRKKKTFDVLLVYN